MAALLSSALLVMDFLIHEPICPYFWSQQGKSTVAFFLLRDLQIQSVKKYNSTRLSYHSQVHSEIMLSTLASLDYVPKSILGNNIRSKRVCADYQKLNQPVVAQLNRDNILEELAADSRFLVE